MRLASTGVVVLLAVVLGGLGTPVFVQSEVNNIHQATAPPLSSRFEIVQSQLAAKWTFRLDRYTGRVDQLARTENDGLVWEQMVVEGMPEVDRPNRSRFVIFTSGLAARHTFLLDSDTGQTWVLTRAPSPESGSESSGINIWLRFQTTDQVRTGPTGTARGQDEGARRLAEFCVEVPQSALCRDL